MAWRVPGRGEVADLDCVTDCNTTGRGAPAPSSSGYRIPESNVMSTRSVLLVISFLSSIVGGALGASTNSPELMTLGALPGIVGILGLMFINHR